MVQLNRVSKDMLGFKIEDTPVTEMKGGQVLGEISRLNNKGLTILGDLEDREINVKWFGAIGNGIADDTTAIEEAIAYLYQRGGGRLFFPKGTYLISRKIVLTGRNVLITGSGHATVIKAGSAIDIMIEYSGNTGYGHRGGGISNLLINGNSLANYGLLIGYSTGTVVGEYFHHIRIENTLKWGMVWDACQNNSFHLIDIEYCGGSLLVLNGAGNNQVTKSEFASMRTYNHVKFAADASFPGYNNNAFGNMPQANKFYVCVFERGEGLSAIQIDAGRHNQFNDCEFSTAFTTVGAVYIDSATALTHITRCRFAGGQTLLPAIINHGYNTYITDCYFENFTNDEILVSNRTVISDDGSNHSSKAPRIRNIGGDAGANIVLSSAPRYIAGLTTPQDTRMSEFYHNDQNQIFFQAKSKMLQILAAKNFSYKYASATAAIEQTTTLTIPREGSWNLEVCVGNGDYKHTRSMTLTVRFRNKGETAYNLANVQKIGTDVVSGTVISDVVAVINENGVLTLTVKSTLATTINVLINAVCQIEY